MNEEAVFVSDIKRNLPDRLEERQPLDVSDRPTEFRDHDIDILEAISISQGRNNGQDIGRSALNNDVTISASQAVILRKLPNGSQVPILVDLYRARKFRSERMLIEPGDYIILQYTKTEAIGAFFERHILESALFGLAAAQLSTGR